MTLLRRKRIVLVGGGGHCSACADVIESTGRYRIVGIVDPKADFPAPLATYSWLGDDDVLPALAKRYEMALVTVGHLKTATIRNNLFEMIVGNGFEIPTIISPNAAVSSRASVGRGTIVLHGATINIGVAVGDNCIINSNALVEHGSSIGQTTHVSTGVCVNGDCVIGSRVFIGSNSTILEGVNVCDDVIIGAGSLVRHSIGEPGTYAGSPSRNIGRIE